MKDPENLENLLFTSLCEETETVHSSRSFRRG